MQREACLPKQPWVSTSTYTSFLYLSFQYYRLHSTLFRDIDESLLYSTDSDEEDPFFSCRHRQPWPRGVVQGASACWLVQILGAGALLIRDKKLPSSPHQRNIGLQKKSTPVSWAAPSLKSADKCSKGRPQLSKQR